MREPTSKDRLYAWHAAALRGTNPGLHEGVDGIPEDDSGMWPCGWYRVRHVKRGPYVPARIYVFALVDPATGELIADEQCRCEIDGEPRNPMREISWMIAEPIKRSEFEYMTALRRWQRVNAPDEFEAAWRPVDHLSTPIPE